MLFAELGTKPADDLFLRVEYDGAIASNGATSVQTRQDFGVLSGTANSTQLMESFLGDAHNANATLENAIRTALDAWSVGGLALGDDGVKEIPSREQIAARRKEELAVASIEAAVLERNITTSIRYRSLSPEEIKSAMST